MIAKRTRIYALSLALVISLIPVSAYAQTVIQPPADESSCSLAKQKITAHLATIAPLQTEHANKYVSIKNRIDKLAVGAEDAQYTSVNKITAAYDSVNKAISTYTEQAKVYVTALQTAQAALCGEEAGEFTSALSVARTELVTLRTATTSVKTAVTTIAAPALRDYATWLKTNTSTTQENI